MSSAGGQTAPPEGRPGLRQVVLEDLRRTDILGRFGQELRDLRQFYLDDEDREELASMGWLRRGILFYGWLFKSLLMKLSPARRLALLASLLLVLLGRWQISLPGLELVIHMRIVGVALLLILLMLELKDKLLARDEIEVARQVQLALLPHRHPQLDGWSVWSYTRPANDVGGDLVDYIELADHRLGVALGDVAGKGLGAALLMAKLQATLRATAPVSATLAELGSRLNAILLRDGLDNRYATLFYLELEPAGGRVSYLNAGHNPPFALCAGGMQSLGPSCLPLGMMQDARFVHESLEMTPGDMIIAYSDGLTEARNGDDQEFGTEKLARLVSGLRGLQAEVAGARLLQEIDTFLGEARPHDDLSLVVVARSEQPVRSS